MLLFILVSRVVSLSVSLSLSLSLSHTQSHNHLCSHKQMCSSLCVASFIQFCKCTWAVTVMLNVAVMWSNCTAWVMVNRRKLHSAEIVRRVGPRQWLWWKEQQLVWHRREGEGEENNVEEDQQMVPVLVEPQTGDVNWEGALFSIHWLELPSKKAAFYFILHKHYF